MLRKKSSDKFGMNGAFVARRTVAKAGSMSDGPLSVVFFGFCEAASGDGDHELKGEKWRLLDLNIWSNLLHQE